eukprot:TRINITY_DN2860_c0_g5_i1.p1 TRINITY_DN2860_c0_g5~~TRINITY_DN2860_c0_g5_i1.p1  ORF type:complete len:716 (-),score=142.02 TRINITY_DN2860_c0_g5_i1:468-2615(-)
MGEVVMSGEEDREVVLEEEEREKEVKNDKVLRLESILPRMVLRVLLVESDDSTRQIIAALLRKCNYKVAAVSDGLKAWKALKDKPNSVDLVLSEVELPSISGFSLLAMIMGHETCKNIPVIMMSSHDSMSVVFKCMLKGAADFLVKPLRKNELRNLWQHVWRRHSSCSEAHGHQDGNFALPSENNAASNHSSDYVASMQKNRECSEKGSDAQSSCTKPDMEAESAYVQNMQELLQRKCRNTNLVHEMKAQECGEHTKLNSTLRRDEKEAEDESMRFGSEMTPCNQTINLEEGRACFGVMTQNKNVAPENCRENANNSSENNDYNFERLEPSREVIDLIGAIDNRPQCGTGHVSNAAVQEDGSTDVEILSNAKGKMVKISSMPLLELSLRRYELSSCQNHETEEKHALKHSNASAFSRYNNRTVQPPFPTLTSINMEPKESVSHSHKSNQSPSDAPKWNGFSGVKLNNNQGETNSLVVCPPNQDEMVFQCPRLGIVPVRVPIRGMTIDSLGYSAVMQPIFYAQSTPCIRTNSTCRQEEAFRASSSYPSNPEISNSQLSHLPPDQNSHNPIHLAVPNQEQNILSTEDQRHVSNTTGQSGSSSLCHGSRSNLNSSGGGSVCNGSNGNVTAAAVARVAAESGSDEGLCARDEIRVVDYHTTTTQREAALTKFRLKRKDRCYEKKVRYQSRKKLAEQRPRVKGQFVRQVQCDPISMETDC